jgi:hypothetical protein
MSKISNDSDKRRQSWPIEPGQVWRKGDQSGSSERLIVGVPNFSPYAGQHVCYVQTYISGSGARQHDSSIRISRLDWFRAWVGKGNFGAELVNPPKEATETLRSQNPGGRLELAPQRSEPR